MKRMGFLSFALSATLTTACWSNKGSEVGQATSREPDSVGGRGAAVENRRVVAVDVASQDAKDFIRHLATVNMAEIDLGNLAAARGTANEVKKFAQMIIDDHSGSGDRLKALASDLKIEAPGQLDEKHIGEREKLAKRSGTDLDREYVNAMVDGHKDLIDQLEPRIEKKTLEQWKGEMKGKTTVAAGTSAVLPDPSDNPTTMRINQFAAELYPTVHAHLEAAKILQHSIQKRSTTP